MNAKNMNAESATALTANQQQLWFIDEFHHGLAAHNLAWQLSLRGRLDLAALRRALDALVARHPALRTRMPAAPDGRPTAIIDPPGPVKLALSDAKQGHVRDLAIAEAARPFRLAADWPMRAHLVRVGPEEHELVVVVHQVAFDDGSLGVLLRDLAALYAAEATGRPFAAPTRPATAAPASTTPASTTPASTAPASGGTSGIPAAEDYWLGALAGFPVSRFPADRQRPLLASHDGAVETVTIDADVCSADLLSALFVLLYRYTGQTDLIIGTTSPVRDRPDQIGYLENVLPIRVELATDSSFFDVTAQVRRAVADASAHQELPFARIVELLEIERDTGRFPVFQTWFGWHEPATQVTSAGVTFAAQPAEVHASRYDLGIDAWPGEDGLRISATYPPALFDQATIQRLLGHLQVLLRAAAADPATGLTDLPVLTDAELHREITEWNDTAREFPQICIHDGFEEQVARAPAAIAAEFDGERVSYAELDNRAERIAARLRDLGVGSETLVGVCMRTGITRLATLLGIWKAGGGYVPLDPGLPSERLGYMIGDTGMCVVVADEESAASLPATSASLLLLGDGHLPAPAVSEHAHVRARPWNVAYVIYTSGSTGQPKGVVVEHRQAINFLQGMIGAWHITPNSAVLSFAAYTFDVSVMDMFMPLLAGAKVVLAPAETLHSPPRLAALIRSSKVTFACLPPAVLSLLVGEDFPDLHTLLSAGEELTSELLRSWMRDGLEIYNGYGPTECSIGSTFMKLDPATPLPPPIGRPKPNYQAYVLDEHLNPVPVGVTGELHVGGVGVARGYLNRPELTAEKFIDDPFRSGGRLYKTGDLVRRRLDGTLVFAGRIDHQVKINGLRVELGEIEAALLSHPEVGQAVVTATNHAGRKQLAGYVRADAGSRPQVADLRSHLARTLPGYMIPSYLIVLDELPLTTNGKVDKSALPPPESVAGRAEPVPPRTLMETMLVDLYSTVLGNENIGTADSFFDAGGDSLRALQLISRLYAELAVDLDVSAVFLNPTARQLAAVLRDKHGFDDADLDPESLDDLERLLG
ncbi:MAG TPA: amino acid adenylation domain-containing protein [Streptosporangiaceae bacterium]|nr:amino acid adenylation domain-containing protein [Streptosporangiaceae bacterium]